MALLDNLFGKKKKTLRAQCPITKETIDKDYCYLLTTAQVVTSKKYWDMVMTEPETLSYTISHFKNQPEGTQMRGMIFEKYASISKPWIVSPSVIGYFDVDKQQAKEAARQWWLQEGDYEPEANGPAAEHLTPTAFENFKAYAILEAGKARVS